MIKEPEEEPPTPIINPDTDLEVKKRFFISVPYDPGLSEEYRGILQHIPAYKSLKGANTLQSFFMHPKGKIPSQTKMKHSLQIVLPRIKFSTFFYL